MKKLFFSLITTFLVTSVMMSQNFEQSAAILLQGRVATNIVSGKSAKTFKAQNFNSAYRLQEFYTVNGVDFTDDGRNYDLIAGDGIYTSSQLTPNPTNSLSPTDLNVIISDNFQHITALNQFATQSKIKIRIKCKLSYTNSGVSSLSGIPCARLGGCLVISDCEAEFEWEWEW